MSDVHAYERVFGYPPLLQCECGALLTNDDGDLIKPEHVVRLTIEEVEFDTRGDVQARLLGKCRQRSTFFMVERKEEEANVTEQIKVEVGQVWQDKAEGHIGTVAKVEDGNVTIGYLKHPRHGWGYWPRAEFLAKFTRYDTQAAEPKRGTITDVRTWDRALTPAEVKAYYDEQTRPIYSHAPSTCKHCKGCYRGVCSRCPGCGSLSFRERVKAEAATKGDVLIGRIFSKRIDHPDQGAMAEKGWRAQWNGLEEKAPTLELALEMLADKAEKRVDEEAARQRKLIESVAKIDIGKQAFAPTTGSDIEAYKAPNVDVRSRCAIVPVEGIGKYNGPRPETKKEEKPAELHGYRVGDLVHVMGRAVTVYPIQGLNAAAGFDTLNIGYGANPGTGGWVHYSNVERPALMVGMRVRHKDGRHRGGVIIRLNDNANTADHPTATVEHANGAGPAYYQHNLIPIAEDAK